VSASPRYRKLPLRAAARSTGCLRSSSRPDKPVATYANVALTLTFWRIGHLIDLDVLGQQRADYGKEIYA